MGVGLAGFKVGPVGLTKSRLVFWLLVWGTDAVVETTGSSSKRVGYDSGRDGSACKLLQRQDIVDRAGALNRKLSLRHGKVIKLDWLFPFLF